MTPVQLDRLFYLLGSLREGILSKPEFAELNRILETDSEGRDYYVDYMYLCADLCNLQAATSHNSLFWDALQEGAGEADLARSGGASILFETMKLLGEEEKNRLLKTYWSISERQVETSVVLANPKWGIF